MSREVSRELGSSAGNAFYQAQSSAVLGLIDNWRGDYAAATAKAGKGVAFARGHNQPFALLQGLFYLGLPLAGQGRYDDARATFTEALELAAKLGDEIFRNRFLNSLAWVLAECGDLEHAIELDPLYADVIVRRLQTPFEIRCHGGTTWPDSFAPSQTCATTTRWIPFSSFLPGSRGRVGAA